MSGVIATPRLATGTITALTGPGAVITRNRLVKYLLGFDADLIEPGKRLPAGRVEAPQKPGANNLSFSKLRLSSKLCHDPRYSRY
jgi:hypothetical protein